MPTPRDAPRVHPETRSRWRQWLLAHHESESAVWLVSWRKATGRPAVGYDGAVSEALAIGWVDSLPRRLDAERTMLCFTPRRATSAWSRPNKGRVEQLRRDGAMTPAGERAVAAAVGNGAWSRLDAVEDLLLPDDLAAALTHHRDARRSWEAFPPSARRGILEWVVQARRPSTRAARVEETARPAARGERAQRWRGAGDTRSDGPGRAAE